VDVLHGDEARLIERAELEDGGDVGVVDQGGEARLVEEHVHELLLVHQVLVDLLDGQQLLELLGALQASQVQRGHAAAAHLDEQLVAPEAAPRDALVGLGLAIGLVSLVNLVNLVSREWRAARARGARCTGTRSRRPASDERQSAPRERRLTK